MRLPRPPPPRRLLISFRQLSGDMERSKEQLRAEVAAPYLQRIQQLQQVGVRGKGGQHLKGRAVGVH
jgi:hypothetical protein